jgi:peptidoglycan/LPS O-acetylase OafA/YrhL
MGVDAPVRLLISMAARRFRVLDGWRGVSALFVALHHFSGQGFLYRLAPVRGAWLFVDFFFVLSGFVIAHAYGGRLADWADAKDFVLRRFARLWPLHAAVLLGFIVLEAGKLVIPGGTPAFTGTRSVDAIATNLLLIQSFGLHGALTWNDPSWSIGVEFYTYLVFAFACLVAKTPRPRVLLAIALTALGVVVLLTCSRWGMRETFGWGFFRCLYGFFLGVLTYRVWQWGWFSRASGTALEIAAAALALAFVSWAPAHRAFEYLAPVVFAFVVWSFSWEKGALSRLMAARPVHALGRWSYSIYMVHVLVLAVLFSALTQFDKVLHSHWLVGNTIMLRTTNISDVVAALYLAVVIALSALTYRFIELPGQRIFGASLAPRARPR